MNLTSRIRIQLDIELQHGPSCIWGERVRLFAVKNRGESMRHVTMKILAWIAWYSEGLEIERSVDQHHKPDVVRVDSQGRPTLWIECGAIGLPRLERVLRSNRGCRFVVVKSERGELHRYAAAARRRLPNDPPVEWVTFGDGYALQLAGRLHHRHDMAVVVAPDRDRMWITLDEGTTDDVSIVYV